MTLRPRGSVRGSGLGAEVDEFGTAVMRRAEMRVTEESAVAEISMRCCKERSRVWRGELGRGSERRSVMARLAAKVRILKLCLIRR